MKKACRLWSTGLIGLVLVFVLLPSVYAAPPPLLPAAAIHTDIYGTSIVSEKVQVMVGYRGKIYRSEDAGKNWTEIPTGTKAALFGVHFPDAQNGWVVGKEGLVMHTADGGQTWKVQQSGIKKHLFSVYFSDAKNGVAVGDWSAMIRTEDGGQSWQLVTFAEDVLFYHVGFFNAKQGCVVGEFGRILITDDSGKTWKQVQTPSEGYTLVGLAVEGQTELPMQWVFPG